MSDKFYEEIFKIAFDLVNDNQKDNRNYLYYRNYLNEKYVDFME
jgi:hypothetical protein